MIACLDRNNEFARHHARVSGRLRGRLAAGRAVSHIGSLGYERALECCSTAANTLQSDLLHVDEPTLLVREQPANLPCFEVRTQVLSVERSSAGHAQRKPDWPSSPFAHESILHEGTPIHL